MSDIFISYARSTAAKAQQVADALRALGYGVWRDDELPAHRAYADVIRERLQAAKAVVVIWSSEAANSEWVRSEAERARADHKLVQLTVDGAELPMPFDQIQCADLNGWSGEVEAAGWRKVVASIGELTGPPSRGGAVSAPGPRKHSICVLPFANISDDPQQEYFSDGISEDIITGLSKISALAVVSRNSAFRFKGTHVDLPKVARELSVSHVLEGSVRKVGNRVRITAQLIDGATNDHVWAERYDRDLTDIFALQDEISEAIVKALKLKLLPEEKKAIERRGTDNADAYNLYLMAKQAWANGNDGDVRREDTMIRLCRRAIEIDNSYARAWALMALAQTTLHFTYERPGDDGLAAAERALSLDPNLAEAYAVKARHLAEQGRKAEAAATIEAALRLDPDSFEVNTAAARLSFMEGRMEDAIRYYETASALMESDFGAPGMLVTCYSAAGDAEGRDRSARTTLARVEKVLAQDQSNGSAMSFGVTALSALGEQDKARDWARRAQLIDPDNMLMNYNCACALSVHLNDAEGALELLGPFLPRMSKSMLRHIKTDPDMDPIRDDPRFKAMLGEAEARLAAGHAEGAA
jgi:adenylate cyclase